MTVDELESKFYDKSIENNNVRPEDLIHLFDVLLKSVAELLTLSENYMSNQEEIDVLTAMEHKYQTFRSFYIGLSYANAGKVRRSILYITK